MEAAAPYTDTPDEQGVATAEEPSPELTEDDAVLAWRLEQSVALGCDVGTANTLAAALYVDGHRVPALIDGGCSHELAARISL